MTPESHFRRFARRVVDAEALALAIRVLSDGWTVDCTLLLVRLAAAAAANNDGSRVT